MMDIVPAKGRSISKVYEENDAVFMVSEAGVLRIIPQKGGIVRVSFSGDGYGYENGEYVITDFSWNDKDRNYSYESVGDMRFRKGKINYKIIH